MHLIYKDDNGKMNVTNSEKWVAKKVMCTYGVACDGTVGRNDLCN